MSIRNIFKIALIFSVLTLISGVCSANLFQVTQNTDGSSAGFAGYQVMGSSDTSITEVKGAWTVPTCSNENLAYCDEWVGIEGSGTVAQIGTEQIVCKANGQKFNFAWYEMYPNTQVVIPDDQLTIHAGDKVGADVYLLPDRSKFLLSINDLTTGQRFSTYQSATGMGCSTADWVIESTPGASLMNFGIIGFGPANTGTTFATLCTVDGVTGNIGTFANSPDYEVDQVSLNNMNDQAMAQTSALSSDGKNFKVTWKRGN